MINPEDAGIRRETEKKIRAEERKGKRIRCSRLATLVTLSSIYTTICDTKDDTSLYTGNSILVIYQGMVDDIRFDLVQNKSLSMQERHLYKNAVLQNINRGQG